MIGSVLGHYRIVEKLGEGGMGVVYKARDLHLERSVALKILPPEQLGDAEGKQRFAQEARAASALNHPNIVTIYDISSDAGTDFIAMELVPGKTLDQLIPPKGMGLNRALKIALQVADALAAAHAIGIVHRDVKPSNIMVGDGDRVKVMDFGLAKLQGLVAEPDVSGATAMTALRTEAGRIVGTLHYMSPEQAEGRAVDERSDIFSFGSLLYEMLSGQRPFQGDSAITTLAAIVEKEPLPLPTGMPAGVEKVLERCLRKDPSRRYQHMADVAVELRDLVEESDSKQRAFRAKPSSARRWGWLAVAGALIAVAGTAWLVVARWPRTLPSPSVVTLTTYPGEETAPALSPDGKQIAFVWNGGKGDNTDIYVQFVGDTRASRLTSDPRRDASPCWSPDGSRIAFRRRTGPGVSAVILVSPLGGPEQVLGEFAGLPPLNTGMSWSPDGKYLAVGRASSSAAPRVPVQLSGVAHGTYLIPLSGGEPRRITTAESPESDWYAQFSPDGTALAFFRAKLEQASADLYVVRLNGNYEPSGAPRKVTRERIGPAGLAWTPDGRTLVYGGQAGFGLTYLYRVPADGSRPPERIELAGLNASYPSISRNRLAFSRNLRDVDIWSFRVGGGPEPLIRSSFLEWVPQFSPDGKKVAFQSNRDGTSTQIWVADADGSNAVQLTHGPGPNQGTPRWSQDGQLIAFDSLGLDGKAGVYTIASTGGQPRPFMASWQGGQPSWSRDGRSIYFQSNRSGRFEIWRCPFPDGPEGQCQQMTTNGGNLAFESVDGKTLYYTDLAGALYAKPLGGGADQRLIDKVSLGFAVHEKGVFYGAVADKDGKIPLLFYEYSSRAPRELARIAASNPWDGSFAVSPDATTFLYAASLYSGQDLVLIENFR